MHHDDRLPLAKAYQRAARGVTVAVGMVVPGLLGYWVDCRLGTRAVFTIGGFGLGMTYGILEMVRMTRVPSERESQATTWKKRRTKSDARRGHDD